MNYPKIVLLVVLGLTATACGNDKTPNALSPSATPTAPIVPATSSPEATSSNGTSTVAPLPGEPPLVPATTPTSGVNPPGTYSGNSGNIRSGSNDDPPPRRKKAQVKKVTQPSPKVTYYDTPVKGKPSSKPAKPVKENDGEGIAEEAEKPKKLPTKPVKKPKDTSNDSSDEKEPAAKPAKPPKAEADGGEGKKTKLPKAEADGGESKKAKPPADADSKN